MSGALDEVQAELDRARSKFGAVKRAAVAGDRLGWWDSSLFVEHDRDQLAEIIAAAVGAPSLPTEDLALALDSLRYARSALREVDQWPEDAVARGRGVSVVGKFIDDAIESVERAAAGAIREGDE